MRLAAGNILVEKIDPPGGTHQVDDPVEGGGFPRAVTADKGHNLPVVNINVHPFQPLNHAVKHF